MAKEILNKDTIAKDKEQMNIVIVGHVDHGKSTVIGRLLADTGSLPDGKLEAVKANCARNAKPFEYAFLLDALKNEQDQGITIDTARSFFKTNKRHYIIIDAPGHIEFLKNMVTGAARAEAALLVIDAKEGIRENSKRHGHMVSMLGIKDVVVLVNKLDLVDYSEEVFNQIQTEFTAFLKQLNVVPIQFIPIAARDGVNIAKKSELTPWFKGPTILEQLDRFEVINNKADLPFRLPVQGIYKFTQMGDDRRIVTGTVESGKISVGDEVAFYPSGKKSKVASIELFNAPHRTTASVGDICGYTMETQIYAKAGELMAKVNEPQPKVSNRFRVNLFWVGRAPMIKGKSYKVKMHATRIQVRLVDIVNVLDSSELTSVANKQQVDRLDVAEVILETSKPVSFDLTSEVEGTGRVVIVDNFEIAGGGIILDSINEGASILKQHIEDRENAWERGAITPEERASVYSHKPKFIVFSGDDERGKVIAKALERKLFDLKYKVFYLGMSTLMTSLEGSINQDEQVKFLGELARFFTGSGQILISALGTIDDYDIENLKILNYPNEILVINVGENRFTKFQVDANIEQGQDMGQAVDQVLKILQKRDVIPVEYFL